MATTTSTMAQQVARAASAFQQQRTGHAPKAVTVVLSEDTLVVTLHEALTPAEKALAQNPAGDIDQPTPATVSVRMLSIPATCGRPSRRRSQPSSRGTPP